MLAVLIYQNTSDNKFGAVVYQPEDNADRGITYSMTGFTLAEVDQSDVREIDVICDEDYTRLEAHGMESRILNVTWPPIPEDRIVPVPRAETVWEQFHLPSGGDDHLRALIEQHFHYMPDLRTDPKPRQRVFSHPNELRGPRYGSDVGR